MRFLLIFGLILSSEAIFFNVHWNLKSSSFSLLAVVQLVTFFTSFSLLIYHFRRKQTNDYRVAFNSFGVMIAVGIPSLLFLIPGLIWMLFKWFFALYFGWTITVLLFIGILIGIIFGRWNWKIHRKELFFDDLPECFEGKTMVQISDIHVGSFFKYFSKVEGAVEMINQLNADFVVFTGDMVNNLASEMLPWIPIFSKIKAKEGKFSILGNHDYADYVPWEDQAKKAKNLEELIEIHQQIGFTPLLNETVKLSQNVALIGVENWGVAPFRQSGKLEETLEKVNISDFKILLSHDPSHFDEQVKVKTDIALTLSGHTHGMQFGIERFGIKWSPVSLKYKKWAGLYEENNQKLYVNRGFGYIGFPGRVGIYPEITCFTFRSTKKRRVIDDI